MNRFLNSITIAACLAVAGCIVPYRGYDRTKVQEWDAYGQHWIYVDHMWSRGGLALLAGHGGATTSSSHRTKTIRVATGEPMNVQDRISIIQATGDFKHYRMREMDPRWFKVFFIDHRILLVLNELPSKVTDAGVTWRIYDPESIGEGTNLLGEWDPVAMEFKIDQHLSAGFSPDNTPLTMEHVQKALKLKLSSERR